MWVFLVGRQLSTLVGCVLIKPRISTTQSQALSKFIALEKILVCACIKRFPTELAGPGFDIGLKCIKIWHQTLNPIPTLDFESYVFCHSKLES